MTPATPAPGRFAPAPAPAPLAARVRAQSVADARTYVRNGEQLVLTMVLPTLIMVAMAGTNVPDLGVDGDARLELIVAGVLALAVISTSFTGQAIGTGFDRRYGVLRLLAATPLGRDGLLGARVLAVLAVELVQVSLLCGVGTWLGWRPGWSALAPGLLALVLGTAAFVTFGLLLAGTLRAEAVLAVANLLWVLMAVGCGVLVPPERWETWGTVVTLLPPGALGELSRTALVEGTVSWSASAVLVVWTILGVLAVRRWFRWE